MSRQKYKIYVNGTPVFLTSREGVADLGIQPDRKTLVNFYPGKNRYLKNFCDLLENNTKMNAVVIWADDVENLWADFQACFKMLEAAGGVVENEKNELLVFFRRDFWDLPKGKIDAGETPEQAAVREVQEETGLKNVILGDFIDHTWHTYRQKKERILKKTWWFKMQTTDTELVPQTEEDIEEIGWVEPKKWLADDGLKVYGSIREVLEKVYFLEK